MTEEQKYERVRQAFENNADIRQKYKTAEDYLQAYKDHVAEFDAVYRDASGSLVAVLEALK